ncbi:MAG: M67 family peptidase [Caldilineae bacterium]|nr:MAG: M67 family peptidase [Caldilineae bacterium]
MNTPIQPVILPQSIYDEIIAHARAGKPEEVCGVLRGRDSRAKELFRGRNIAEDKINNYTVDPQTLLRQFEFEDAGDAMMGIYHSHPVSVAYPSATDAWNAHYPDAYYLICSLEFDDAPVIRAFKMTPTFPDLDMEALRQALPFEEVRPGLFGLYVPAGGPIPEPLQSVVEDPSRAFYVVFNVNGAGKVDEHRIVFIEEHPVEVAG